MDYRTFPLFALALALALPQPHSRAQSSSELPESIISAPERDSFTPSIAGDTFDRSSSTGGYMVSIHEKTNRVVGFTLFNEGPNSIIPHRGEIGEGPDREYGFHFQDRARQNIYINITDSPTAFLSHRMESFLYFFPRTYLPAITSSQTQGSKILTVTLPTGETVQFNGDTREVVGGVIQELAPIDLGPDRFKRKFAQFQYHGTGVMIRVDRRGADPRLGTIATVTQGQKICKIPSSLLFNQDERSEVEFLYPSDAGFNELLKKKCGFSFL
jgi:hypothetical protein